MRSLHNQTLAKEKELEKAQAQLNDSELQRKACENLLLEANQRIKSLEEQCEKSAIKVEKTAGSTTSLRKLQQDMQEWRKQSDSNLR